MAERLNWMERMRKKMEGGKKPHGIMLCTSFIRLNKCYRKVSKTEFEQHQEPKEKKNRR